MAAPGDTESTLSRRSCFFIFLLVSSLALLYRVTNMEKYLIGTLNENDNQIIMTSKARGRLRRPPMVTSFPRNHSKHPVVYDMNTLERKDLPHGSFLFGPHSHQVNIKHNFKQSWTEVQKELIDDDDDIVDIEKEKERCDRYNFKLANEKNPKRRRLFLGSLLANDSLEVLKAVGTEAWNMFHTVSFIEGNVTQNLSPREWKYYDPNKPSEHLNTLYQLFGPKTKVSVDYYVSNLKTVGGNELITEFLQREGSMYRWEMNGMQEDDIGIILDADEIFTRDFLRAMQVCDMPEFNSNQDCREPKLIASTIVMESSPNCVTKDRRWHHPDAIIGKCLKQVGNETLHPPTKREYKGRHGMRQRGYGFEKDYSKYVAEGFGPKNTYPLWDAVDFRMEVGGNMRSKGDGSPTGYHFHNFFNNGEEIHVKYRTYGHSIKSAMEMPLWDLSADLKLAVDCTHDSSNDQVLDFNNTGSSNMPIYYLNEKVRNARHQLWKKIVQDEEGRVNGKSKNGTVEESDNDEDESPVNEQNSDVLVESSLGSSASASALYSTKSHWDSSKSAVLGLATGLSLGDYQNFVGSLRATGFPGHIILGIAKDAPKYIVDYLTKQNVTIQFVEMAEKCTYDGAIGHDGEPGKPIDTSHWHCPKDFPDFKITWARFPIYKQWLEQCPDCTDGIVLTDVRDAYFQRDPFTTAVKLQMQHPLMVFEEIYPELDNTHWLTDFPVKFCKNITVGNVPMLCSGSVMGSREGIIDYIDTMVDEFNLWMKSERCRINMPGDDQSVHNYLYYTNRLKNAIAIPHRTGPLHVVGWQAARVFERAQEEAKGQGVSNLANFYVKDDNWKNWLPEKYGLLDPNTGLLLNKDGSPSAQAHQVDRFGDLNKKWITRMNEEGWSYNKDRL
mmetsp:Transcript_2515/g.5495  ORF Transcript_2515/g.5495 Transcript_2515/m.5495 type:complete len:894 (+) Transcript_2515:69-2750(+)